MKASFISNVAMGSFLVHPRRSKVRCHVFWTLDPQECQASPEPEENIHSLWVAKDALTGMIQNGDIDNIEIAAAWTYYQIFRASTNSNPLQAQS